MAKSKRRNDFDGNVGGVIQPTASVQVLAIGRYYGSGNGVGKHELIIIDPAADTIVANVTVNGTQPLDDLGFAYTEVSTNVTLAKGQIYYLVSWETNKGDYFFGDGGSNPQAMTTPNLTLLESVYFYFDKWHMIGNPGTIYGPLNLLIQ